MLLIGKERRQNFQNLNLIMVLLYVQLTKWFDKMYTNILKV